MVNVVLGDQLNPCHPLLTMSSGNVTGDRHHVFTECRGIRGQGLIIFDNREKEDYFGICDVKAFRFLSKKIIL